MSQNFELLSQLEAELAFGAATPKVTKNAALNLEEIQTDSANKELLNLAQTVFLSKSAGAPREVVLCGVDKENGSGQICVQLGRILANSSSRPVCLVDASVGSFPLSRLLNVEPRPIMPASPDEGIEQVGEALWLTSIDTLGCRRGDTLAATEELGQNFERLRKMFEFVLVNAPAASSRNDAAVLSQFTSGAILVLEAHSTRKAAALRAKNAMEAMNVRFLGCVLNNRTYPIPEKLYRRI
jgi:Mrp family chromosome partitioning ATPase